MVRRNGDRRCPRVTLSLDSVQGDREIQSPELELKRDFGASAETVTACLESPTMSLASAALVVRRGQCPSV